MCSGTHGQYDSKPPLQTLAVWFQVDALNCPGNSGFAVKVNWQNDRLSLCVHLLPEWQTDKLENHPLDSKQGGPPWGAH